MVVNKKYLGDLELVFLFHNLIYNLFIFVDLIVAYGMTQK